MSSYNEDGYAKPLYEPPKDAALLMHGDIIDGDQLTKILGRFEGHVLVPNHEPYTAAQSGSDMDRNDLFEVSIGGEQGAWMSSFSALDGSAVLSLEHPKIVEHERYEHALEVPTSVGSRVRLDDPRVQLTPKQATSQFERNQRRLDDQELVSLVDAGADPSVDCVRQFQALRAEQQAIKLDALTVGAANSWSPADLSGEHLTPQGQKQQPQSQRQARRL